MGDMMKKQIDKFEADYNKIASKEAWEPKDITMMKDLQKLMYYLEVRCTMKEGGEYPGSEYIDEGSGRSYARNQVRNRNAMGQFTSNGSGMYPMGYGRLDDMSGTDGMSGRRYYDGGSYMRGGSGRRYYDAEKEKAIHELHRLMDSKDDPEIRATLQNVIHELEMK